MSIGLALFVNDNNIKSELFPGLAKLGYNLLFFESKKAAIPPGCYEADMIIYELNAEDMESLSLIKELIEVHRKPVIILSRTIDELLTAEIYRLGAQDLIQAPWYTKVIDMRIRIALKRCGFIEDRNRMVHWQMSEDILTLQLDRHITTLNKRELKLTFSQWNILSTLVSNGGVALSRNYLLRECLHFEQGDTRTLDNHIKNLRKVLGSSSSIETIHGYGYKLNGMQLKNVN